MAVDIMEFQRIIKTAAWMGIGVHAKKMTFLKSMEEVFYNSVITRAESDALRERPLPDRHRVIMLNSK